MTLAHNLFNMAEPTLICFRCRISRRCSRYSHACAVRLVGAWRIRLSRSARTIFERLPYSLSSVQRKPFRLGVEWQGAARPSRMLRAAARWPLAILDRRPTARPGKGRSGRRDGLPARTKGSSDASRHLASALTHSVFKRGENTVGIILFDPPWSSSRGFVLAPSLVRPE